jgi:PAS domain S-box-containing protein
MAANDRERGIKHFIRWFLIEQLGWHLLRFVLPVVGALVFGVWWWIEVGNAQEVAMGTLKARLVGTRQEYKGLEASLLSDVDKMIGALASAKVTRAFEDRFSAFQTAVNAGIARSTSVKASNKNEVAQAPNEGLSIDVAIDPRRQGESLSDKYITDKAGTPSKQAPQRNGFLFLPAMVLATEIPSDEQVANPRIIEEATREGRPIRAQLFAAQEIDSLLAGFGGINVFAEGLEVDPKPVQCYYITSSGVIRLFSTNLHAGEEQVRYYEHQFRPTTFFPDRPYFWPTIKHRTRDLGGTDHTVQDVFNQTQPYLDLGGNGVVVTLSIGIKANGVNSGLFLDFKLKDAIKERIREKIKKVGVFAAETSWKLPDDGEPSVIKTANGLDQTREDLCKKEFTEVKQHKKNDQSLSELFGDIYRFEHGEKYQNGESKNVIFTVPLGRGVTDQNGMKVPGGITFLYCELRPEWFRFWVSSKLLACTISLITLVCFIALSLREYKLRLREYDLTLTEHKKFLDRVTQVMTAAPVAYCRLNQNKEFVEVNEAFATMLGYDSKERAEEELICKKKWEDLLDAKSRIKYEQEIQPTRAKRQPTGPYTVKMRRPNGEWVEVVVHGADVPGGKGFPETFGLLLREGSVLVLTSEEMVVRPLYNPPLRSVHDVPLDGSRKPKLFVLMPFAKQIEPVFENHIRSVARTLGVTPTRADRVLETGFVMVKTWEAICAADVIVVDCSDLNPNVLYELGLAHVVKGKKVVLIGQLEPEKLPFNIKGIEYIRYALTLDGMERFKQDLEEKLRAVLRYPKVEA